MPEINDADDMIESFDITARMKQAILSESVIASTSVPDNQSRINDGQTTVLAPKITTRQRIKSARVTTFCMPDINDADDMIESFDITARMKRAILSESVKRSSQQVAEKNNIDDSCLGVRNENTSIPDTNDADEMMKSLSITAPMKQAIRTAAVTENNVADNLPSTSERRTMDCRIAGARKRIISSMDTKSFKQTISPEPLTDTNDRQQRYTGVDDEHTSTRGPKDVAWRVKSSKKATAVKPNISTKSLWENIDGATIIQRSASATNVTCATNVCRGDRWIPTPVEICVKPLAEDNELDYEPSQTLQVQTEACEPMESAFPNARDKGPIKKLPNRLRRVQGILSATRLPIGRHLHEQRKSATTALFSRKKKEQTAPVTATNVVVEVESSKKTKSVPFMPANTSSGTLPRVKSVGSMANFAQAIGRKIASIRTAVGKVMRSSKHNRVAPFNG
ncbi:PREDICTED: uncharacterized protein LOC106807702 [Priapulus caudatus]|uniref:Uncharacterized protein LOC106807702 n=1 Tax=Priapulus caudatus TaxID=37621 RepID=A0ABM1E097_PRICU|nr:PREDICTED: uncharacterized protein LOC106807702 [Priapulus caudatus]